MVIWYRLIWWHSTRKFLKENWLCTQRDVNTTFLMMAPVAKGLQSSFPKMLRSITFETFCNKYFGLPGLADELLKPSNTKEWTHPLLLEWLPVSLKSVVTEKPARSYKECLEILFNSLQNIQASMHIEYKTNSLLRNWLLKFSLQDPLLLTGISRTVVQSSGSHLWAKIFPFHSSLWTF